MPEQPHRHTGAVYSLLVTVGVGAFFAIAQYGQRRWPSATSLGPAKEATVFHLTQLFHLLLALAIVALAGRFVSAGLSRLRQPPVMGQILAGILLGPSLLGHFAPGLADFVLPDKIAPYLGLFSQVGVIFFMFGVGVELNSLVLRRQSSSLVAISHGSIVVPFLLGSICALFLYPRVSSPDVPFVVFALFSGTAVAVTAFPVLSRILTDRNMHRSPIGSLALACASVDDVTAWCLLALIVGVANSNVEMAVWTLCLAAVYVFVMMTGVRKVVAGLIERYDGPVTPSRLALIVVAILASALLTDLIGIHAIFGAFLLGAIVPRDSETAHDLITQIEPFVGALLLPAFFAFTGMRTQIGLVSGTSDWLLCGLIILVASVGKFGGSILLARFSGMRWKDSAVLGILMNTRGLMELIVLNIGLDMKIISPKLFTMYVLMSLVTTLATTPIFDWLTEKREVAVEHASEASLSTTLTQ